jgi:hypothetical protein
MGQFSMEKPSLTGSVLSGNQQSALKTAYQTDKIVSAKGCFQFRERSKR